MSKLAFAARLGVTPPTVYRWLALEGPPRGGAWWSAAKTLQDTGMVPDDLRDALFLRGHDRAENVAPDPPSHPATPADVANALRRIADAVRDRRPEFDERTELGTRARAAVTETAAFLGDCADAIESGIAFSVGKEPAVLGLRAPGQALQSAPAESRTFGHAIRAWRDYLGMSRLGFSRMARVEERVIRKWEHVVGFPREPEWIALAARAEAGHVAIPDELRRLLLRRK